MLHNAFLQPQIGTQAGNCKLQQTSNLLTGVDCKAADIYHVVPTGLLYDQHCVKNVLLLHNCSLPVTHYIENHKSV